MARPYMSNELFDLSGKAAVVAGGTSGIGRTLALGLADAGADVVVVGRREELVNDAAAAIEARGRRTLRMTADVTERASLERVRDASVAAFFWLKSRWSMIAPLPDWNSLVSSPLSGAIDAHASENATPLTRLCAAPPCAIPPGWRARDL